MGSRWWTVLVIGGHCLLLTNKQTNMKVSIILSCIFLALVVQDGQARPQFDLGALFGTAIGSTFATALGRDCRGRAQGDYFYGCQCVGPFNVGRRKRSPQPVDSRFFLNSNQGLGGDLARCTVGSILNRNG